MTEEPTKRLGADNAASNADNTTAEPADIDRLSSSGPSRIRACEDRRDAKPRQRSSAG